MLCVLLIACAIGPLAAAGQASDLDALVNRGSAAGLSAGLLESVVERGERRGLSEDAIRGVITPAIELAENDLPGAPLLTKTLEGIAKNVPPARMQPVLQTFRTHTEEAGRVVDAWLASEGAADVLGSSASRRGSEDRTALIRGVTAARQQNLSLEVAEAWLTALPEAVSARPIAVSQIESAIRVLPQLPDADQPASAGHRLAYAAVEAEYDPSAIRQLPHALEQARRQNEQPVRTLARHAAGAIGGGQPAPQVLGTLFRGGIPGGGPPEHAGPPDDPRRGPPDTPPNDPPGNPPESPPERPDPPPGGNSS